MWSRSGVAPNGVAAPPGILGRTIFNQRDALWCWFLPVAGLRRPVFAKTRSALCVRDDLERQESARSRSATKNSAKLSNYLFSVSLIQPWPGYCREWRSLLSWACPMPRCGNGRGVLNFVPLLWPRHRSHRAGHGGSAYFRHAVARTPAVRLVPAAWHCSKQTLITPVLARGADSRSIRGHFLFLDILDVALGCARRPIVGANPGFNQVISDRVPAMSPVSELLSR